MTMIGCSKENELRQALTTGHWPHAAEEDLRTHVATCPRCTDQVLVARTFRAARAITTPQAPAISAGAIWWKAQIRRRQQALERVQRPLVTAQLFAFVITVLMLAGLVLIEARRGLTWAAVTQALHLETQWFVTTPGVLTLATGLGLFAVLSGLLLYLTTDRR